jgi:hypothetical protein
LLFDIRDHFREGVGVGVGGGVSKVSPNITSGEEGLAKMSHYNLIFIDNFDNKG